MILKFSINRESSTFFYFAYYCFSFATALPSAITHDTHTYICSALTGSLSDQLVKIRIKAFEIRKLEEYVLVCKQLL